MKKGLSRELKVRTVPGTYLHLHHQAPLSPELDDVAVDVHLVLCLQAFQHGVDADVGACAPNASTGKAHEGRMMHRKAQSAAHLPAHSTLPVPDPAAQASSFNSGAHRTPRSMQDQRQTGPTI